jgi:hypothetical protein
MATRGLPGAGITFYVFWTAGTGFTAYFGTDASGVAGTTTYYDLVCN